MSLTAWAVAVALAVAAILGTAWKIDHRADARGYARAQAENQAAAELQREANRSRARDAAVRAAAATVTRETFIDRTAKELRHAASPLDTVPAGADTVRLLNAAAECAQGDRPAACLGADALPDTVAPAK